MVEGVQKQWTWMAIGAAWLLATVGSAGCGPGLGECDMAALMLSTDGSRPYDGQRLVHQTCASGQCHSELAKGAARVGAPADLNFDLVPADESVPELARITRGAGNVDELAEEMWEWIDDGTMPPDNQRMPLEGENKEAVRNWLACGAPMVNKPLAVIAGADWSQIFPSLEASCGACHGAASTTGPWLAMGDACATRAGLLANPPSGPSCSGAGSMLIVPGSPDSSLMLQKLESPMPCGTAMPPGRVPAEPSPLAVPLRQWIAAGALAPGCP